MGGIVKGILTQINADLTVPGALQHISAGFCDMQDCILVGLLGAVHHMAGKAGAQVGQGGENVFFIAGGFVEADPFGLPVVVDLLEFALVDLGIVVNVVGDVYRILAGRLGAGVVFCRGIFYFLVVCGRVNVPGVVILGHFLAI